jgi:DNA-binding Lrp family transcriptional regulator
MMQLFVDFAGFCRKAFYTQTYCIPIIRRGEPGMVSVVILIRAEAGAIWEACQAITEIEGIERADVVTGPYDMIAYAELPSVEDLRKLMQTLHTVEGISRTETCVSI